AIGYVEYAYAKQNNLTYAKMVNKAGKTLEPSIPTFQAAAAGADWAGAKGYYLILTDQAADDAWPITGASFIIVYTHPTDPPALKTALTFFDWAYKNGKDMATELAYVPIPDSVVQMIQQSWSDSLQGGGGSKLWP